MKHHFEKCQEKVEAGKGFKGEECVEELYPDALLRSLRRAPDVRQTALTSLPPSQISWSLTRRLASGWGGFESEEVWGGLISGS
ncbi:hypothetical protein B0H16DRAFT_230691 [Mycena metata]|uniref:Ubiquinol-cytochrome C reductase hinge domain-containing protein n=1 Tax=Mycena metata TaxID=1033252 RepID=A0AAD7HVK5_9AGAR|nr:hypothetical protein B0H16DRAFT_230691 [Mycena metata]